MPVLPALSLLEARVLGVLVEKRHTVPDTYPLTLNALVSGCNQKTARDPVIEASESDVQAALDRLKTLALVVESSGGRVMRYAENVGKGLAIPPQSVAILAVLFLRGPQTAGELRINTERLHRFGDILAVEGFLNELAERPEAAFVRQLPRQPGTREARWTHLLSGEPAPPPTSAAPIAESAPDDDVRARLERLEAQVAELAEALARITSTPSNP